MAKLIPLTQGYEAIVDDADYEWLNEFAWCVWAPVSSKNRYAIRGVPNPGGGRRQTTRKMHRLILPEAEMVDHRDGNGLNNQRANLRPATLNQNARNRRLAANSKSGFIGVSARRGCWIARIRVNSEPIYLGSFADPVAAARARDAAALELHGEFACLNFPATSTTEGEPTA